jgi:U2-associated protein SR140
LSSYRISLPPSLSLPPSQRGDERDHEQRSREHRQQLSESEQAAWELTLRKLTCERASIRAAMVFALDHAEAAKAMVATWADALTLPETPIPKKLARLYLVSDVLHNASTPTVRGAALFRSELTARLRDIFASCHALLAATESRLAAEAFKDKVLRVLRVWHAWSVLAPSRLDELELVFLRGAAAVDAMAATAASATAATTSAAAAAAAVSSNAPQGDADDDDIDGVPLV